MGGDDTPTSSKGNISAYRPALTVTLDTVAIVVAVPIYATVLHMPRPPTHSQPPTNTNLSIQVSLHHYILNIMSPCFPLHHYIMSPCFPLHHVPMLPITSLHHVPITSSHHVPMLPITSLHHVPMLPITSCSHASHYIITSCPHASHYIMSPCFPLHHVPMLPITSCPHASHYIGGSSDKGNHSDRSSVDQELSLNGRNDDYIMLNQTVT